MTHGARRRRPGRLLSLAGAPLAVAIVVAGVAIVAGVAASGPSATLAADPTSAPALPPCEQLYPAEGPAGVDLQLGCAVDRLVSHYTGMAPSASPDRISAFLPHMALAGTAVILAVAAIGWAARRTSRRLAPVLPVAWWACPVCRSVNGAGVDACYACGAPVPDAGTILPTAEHPETPQAFGGTRKEGRGPSA